MDMLTRMLCPLSVLSRQIQGARLLFVQGSNSMNKAYSRQCSSNQVHRSFSSTTGVFSQPNITMEKAVSRLALLQRHLIQKKASLGSVAPYSTSGVVSDAARAVLATRKNIDILDSRMSYLDTGAVAGGKAVVFLHGNPTSAYLWRNIIPHVKPIARCLAPDLIGMGHSGKNPQGSYRFVDHFRYLSKWFESVDLPEKLTIVCHDWGSGLGFHWCNLHRERIEGLVFTEAIVSSIPNWEYFPDIARGIFQALRSPAGEDMVLKKNFFVERLFVGSIMRTLADEEMDEYRMPYKEEGESRRPTLTWPREIPVASDGPKDVVELTNDYNQWLSKSKDLPKLYIDPQPGFFAPGIRRQVNKWPNLRQVQAEGLHFVQEDSPDVMGKAIAEFLKDDVYK